MPGLCEQCPVHEIFAELGKNPPDHRYWGNEEIRTAALGLIQALANSGECKDGPDIEGLGYDTNEILVHCDHPEHDEMAQIGEALEDLGSQVGITPTIQQRTGTPVEIASLAFPRQLS